MTVCPTRPGYTVRESQILHLLDEGSPVDRVIEIGKYRRTWNRHDVDRVIKTRDASRWHPPHFDGQPDPVVLTRAQAAALDWLCHGLTNRGIAEQLGLSEDTVKCRVRALLAALDARDRTHAVVLALTGQVHITTARVGQPRRAA